MNQKKSCKELEQQIRELKKEKERLAKSLQEIEVSEKLSRIALENSSDTVIITDDDGKIVYACPNTTMIFGFSQNEVYRLENIQNMLGGTICPLSDVRKHKEIKNIEWSIRNGSGQKRFLLINVKSVKVQKGKFLYAMHDITDLKLSEKKIWQKQHILESVFEGISDPLIMFDKEMKVKLINNAAKKYYGLSSEFVFEDICCFRAFKQRETPCKGCKLPSALKHNEYLCYERRGCFDSQRIELVTHHPISKTISKNNYFIVRINDITKLRRLEKELSHADKMISLGILVSGVAHEINNPNNFIMMNAQLLLNSWQSIVPILDQYYKDNGDFSMGGLPFSEMRNEFPALLKGIEKSSYRIEQIIMDLKAFSRNDDTRMDETVEINRVIQRAVRLTQKLIKDSTDCFQSELYQDIPTIQGSRQQLEQVIINLIQNACQALQSKKKQVSILSTLNEKKDTIIIEVRDQGEGISPHVFPKVMDPFFTTRREGGGTGLGLSISANIIKKHGGTIKIDSRQGEGSVFKVFLPLYSNENPYKLLVVDDDSGVRKLLKSILGRTGRFNLEEASNGAEALLQIGHNKPDLLIIDIHMPDMDGAELCRLIKNKPELSSIKVIITTGFINSAKAQEISNMGFNTILGKPIETPQLLKTIDHCLETGS